MKATPLLMKGDLVVATLEGRKTETRRLMKPQPEACPDHHPRPGHWWPCNVHQTMLHVEDELQNGAGGWEGLAENACPYGKPGDLLWVREKFQPIFASGFDHGSDPYPDYKTGFGYDISYPATDGLIEWVDADDEITDRCRPSIHMPRWASRLTLEIISVSVERLQDITNESAKAEGLTRIEYKGESWGFAGGNPTGYSSATGAFRALWESINGPGSWEASPWVWVIKYRAINENIDKVLSARGEK